MLLLWHIGAGDAIICNGLVRHLAAAHETLHLPCWPRNLPTLRHMFSDLPNVKFMVVDSAEQVFTLSARKKDIIRLGQYADDPNWNSNHWDREFYRQAGVDFSVRWSGFKVPETLAETGNISTPYCFLHQDTARLYEAARYKAPEGHLTVIPTGYASLLDYVPLIMGARQVHCIDSAFLCLIDSLPSNNQQQLYFHKYARKDGLQPTLRRDWQVVA